MRTLSQYRKMAAVLFGEESPATVFLDNKIKEQGANELVLAAESEMLYLLGELDRRPHRTAEEPVT